jgi:hypothetical protein
VRLLATTRGARLRCPAMTFGYIAALDLADAR